MRQPAKHTSSTTNPDAWLAWRRGSVVTAVLASSLLLGACTTTTTLHYDLNAPPQAAVANLNPNLVNYRINSITVPEPIDAMPLMVRQPDNTLMVLSHDKWVAPLGQVMTQALTNGLSQALGVPPLPSQMTAGGNDPKVATLTVDVREFDMQPAKQATLSALWQVRTPAPASVAITCYSTLSQPVARGVAALVTAQQINVSKLSQQMASVIATTTPVDGARCQTVAP